MLNTLPDAEIGVLRSKALNTFSIDAKLTCTRRAGLTPMVGTGFFSIAKKVSIPIAIGSCAS